jgi:hypothetical protein
VAFAGEDIRVSPGMPGVLPKTAPVADVDVHVVFYAHSGAYGERRHAHRYGSNLDA